MGLGQVMALVAVTMAVLYAGAVAQSGCTSVLIGLAPCLSFVTGSSSTPSSSCCSQLDSVIQSQPRCLCMVLNGGALSSLGVTLNQTLALALPYSCNVQTPPISKCNTSGGTVTPAGSPESSPSDASSGTSSSSGSQGGSEGVSSTAGSSTSHGIAKMPPALPLAVLSVFMATFGYVPTGMAI